MLLARTKANTRVAIQFSKDGTVNDLRAEYDLLRKVAHPNVAVVIDLLEGPRLSSLSRECRKYRAGMIMEALPQVVASLVMFRSPCVDAGLTKGLFLDYGCCIGALAWAGD